MSTPNTTTPTVATPSTIASAAAAAAESARRKDTLNEKITELLELLPPALFADTRERSTGTKDGRPNKGQVLSKAVDYIGQLQEAVDARNREEVALALALRAQQQQQQQQNGSPSAAAQVAQATVAEEMLASVGVGPLAEK
jgi:hypothetical protein